MRTLWELEKAIPASDGGFRRTERSYGSFVPAFSLPETVNGEKMKADYKNGLLTVTLPKKEVTPPKHPRLLASFLRVRHSYNVGRVGPELRFPVTESTAEMLPNYEVVAHSYENTTPQAT